MSNLLRNTVFHSIDEERNRQEVKWGPQSWPNGTSVEDVWLADEYRAICDDKAQRGLVTWRDIFLEEVYEAMAEEDPVKLEKELIQAIAVAVNWVEDIRKRNT